MSEEFTHYDQGVFYVADQFADGHITICERRPYGETFHFETADEADKWLRENHNMRLH